MRRWGAAAGVAALIALAGWGGFSGLRGKLQDDAAREIVANPYLSDAEKLQRLRRSKFRAMDVFQGRDGCADRLLQRLTRAEAAANDPEALDPVVLDAETYSPLVGSKEDDFLALAERARRRAEDLRAARLRQVSETSRREEEMQEALLLFQDFQRRYPASRHLKDLEARARRFAEIRVSEEWRLIRTHPRRRPEDFREIARLLREFRRKFPDHPSKDDLAQVESLCELFSEKRQYHLHVSYSDSGGESYQHVLEVWILDQVVQLKGGPSTTRETWNADRTIAWQPGEGIEVKLFDWDWFRWDLLGKVRRTDGAAIGLLAGAVALEKADQEGCTAGFELQEIPRAAWQLYEKYLGP